MSSQNIMDLLDHKQKVGKFLRLANNELMERAVVHDFSKFSKQEFDAFEEATPKLAGLTYGSDEYKKQFKESGMQKAIEHHYEVNSHHPEHYENGVYDMNLFDLLEMICDWMAAVQRHNDGNILKSLEINKKRFSISDELMGIIWKTVVELQDMDQKQK
jgi:hypothetical protein